ANELSQGVKLVHEVKKSNSDLSYVEFKVLDLAPGSSYEESLSKQECCIVALTGKITVTDHEQTFENIGTRESVFERKPTDSV
ncbi:5-deoxy-glucuronate isomerase, partial [Staphylococcus aureus]|nr:5-deoxy-glucuronate isomerase [Staphylococcus aureus]